MSTAKTSLRTPTASGPAAIERARNRDRAAAQESLEDVLKTVPGIEDSAIPAAIAALLHALDEYNLALPLVDATGRRTKPGIAEARASMRALHKSLETVEQRLAALTVEARQALAFTYGAPIGKFTIELRAFRQAAQTALPKPSNSDTKPPDVNRWVLAYRVAKVFRDILKLKPASTSSRALLINGKRHGAAYARVLRTTLEAVKVFDYDEAGLIRKALKLLKDPLLPPPPAEANL